MHEPNSLSGGLPPSSARPITSFQSTGGGDAFPVFVPALERAFAANRGDVTIIYSFTLLVGGISGPLNGWILDRLGLRALTVIGTSLAAAATFAASQATALWHLYATLGVM